MKTKTVFQISSSSGGTKRGIFIDGAIHAREWVSPAAVCFLIEEVIDTRDGFPPFFIILETVHEFNCIN